MELEISGLAIRVAVQFIVAAVALLMALCMLGALAGDADRRDKLSRDKLGR